MQPSTNILDFPQTAIRHRWGDRVSIVEGTASGCLQSERTCTRCHLVRVTVHPPRGFPWLEWRGRDGNQVQLSTTPPCLPEAGE
jgi:hypothetical protein